MERLNPKSVLNSRQRIAASATTHSGTYETVRPLRRVHCDDSTLLPRPNKFNTLRPRRNKRNLADDIFKRIFLNENGCIFIKISLKFVLKSPIKNIPALVQIMPWRRLDYWRIYASLGLNELPYWDRYKMPPFQWGLFLKFELTTFQHWFR